MIEEQNTPGSDLENTGRTSEEALATSNTSESTTTSLADGLGTPKDEYYEVDYGKKDVLSTIGDGEMHDEGLVGAGAATTNIQSSMERLTDEQDTAESHDSEQ